MKFFVHTTVLFILLTQLVVAEDSLWPSYNSSSPSAGEPFLPADEAFVAEVQPLGAQQLEVNWQIEPGYYLYKDKFRFKIGSPQASIQSIELPKGKAKHDEYFGDVEVYYHGVTATLQLQGVEPRQIYHLEVDYQGCADAGFCYPPIKQRFEIKLPDRELEAIGAASTDRRSSTVSTKPQSTEEDNLAARLANQSLALSLLQFFGFGLLLAFTPCILPMIPILSGLIAGQGTQISTAKATQLSVIYVLAMASAYALAGLAAGLAGQNLQSALQHPYVLIAFSTVFVLLALSMFGLYELQLPRGIQQRLNEFSNRQQGGSYLGVAVMGFLAALIASPCITPPLAAALLYISQTGDGLLGASALFSLALGMGVPLILLGAGQGKFLPKSGPWMLRVKALFGVVLLGVAIWMLGRVINGPLTLVLWGALLVGTAVFLRAFESLPEPASKADYCSKTLGLAAAILGIIMWVGASTGGVDPLAPINLSGERKADHSELEFTPIKGIQGLEQALTSLSGPAMLDFYADWCVACKELEKYTFSSHKVQQSLKDFVLLQTDITQNDTEDQALLKRYHLFGPPTVLFFDSAGNEIKHARIVGYLPPDKFLSHLQDVKQYLHDNAK